MNFADDDLETFWNLNPVGSNFLQYKPGKKFFENYDAFRYRTEGHIIEELDKIDFRNKQVLEIGIGQASDSMQMINRGAIYYGIDLTEESVRRAKERFMLFNKAYEQILKADAQNIPFPDNFFDIVYSHGVIHHSPGIEKIITEIYRVLKPGGKVVVMLYHKQSVNYYLSIALLRRAGLLLMFAAPFLSGLISKLTGESAERINKHKINLKKEGLGYLRMRNFIHRSTDGPDNVYSSVWTKRSARMLFGSFKNITFSVHFLNERHLLGFQRMLSRKAKERLAKRFGWHLWLFANK